MTADPDPPAGSATPQAGTSDSGAPDEVVKTGVRTSTQPLTSDSLHPVLPTDRPHVLEMVAGPGAPTQFVLEDEEIVIGRSSSADLQVLTKGLSRHHVRLVRNGNEYSCHDPGSRNGTFLNGLRIHSAVLRDGDTLQIGDVVFKYHAGS